ncbi:hypothetical protein CFC21_078819 [Triticum aestivum]|uniref:Bifunctional inhibitor/plant lipid transfer protein/seed storage helical domain-containing protein n=2 Tax=Triticum aestivum TaxID=4565 RepID=A0A3B6MVR5_WHEAT|nr:vegetative cell wall protein gp1-like [Triticum aestivum]KAF7073900.1 hypothetical protein CFC21_078819 [Triticum aestivum]
MAISKLIALFFAFAAVAATLPPSEARVQGFTTTTGNQEETDPSSKAAAQAGGAPGFSLPLPQIPGLPPLFGGFPFPPLPQIPGLPPLFGPLPGAPGAPPSPGIPHFPPSAGSAAAPAPPPPAECLTPLMQMAPCVDYLTNITVVAPPSTCCDGLKSVISGAPICLCHGMNGGMSKLFPRPIDPIRMLILPLRCGAMLPLGTLLTCSTQTLPPLAPPSSTPAPPASPVSPAPASSPVSTPTEASP